MKDKRNDSASKNIEQKKAYIKPAIKKKVRMQAVKAKCFRTGGVSDSIWV